MAAEDTRSPVSLTDYVRLLKRRKVVLIATMIAVPAFAISLSLSSQPTYQASSKVLLSEPSSPTIGGLQATSGDPARAAQTQADLARVQEVVAGAVKDAHVPGLTSDALLAKSSVLASPSSDFLTFSVTNSDPNLASRLAMTYAHAFVNYRFGLDSQALARTRAVAERQKKQLEAAGLGNSAAHRSVEQQLAAIDGTEIPMLAVLRSSNQAAKIGPRVKRNAGIAIFLGIVLGLALAFLWDVLDTRVRSIDTVRIALPGLALLGRLPTPARALRKRDGLVMLTAPTSAEAEPIRTLRANFEFAVRGAGAKTIIFTSAIGGEGKSTTVANLAVALARAGRRVVLVDYDLRNPGLQRFFRIRNTPGLVDVIVDDADLDRALAEVRMTDAAGHEQKSPNAPSDAGTLEVLPLGQTLQDPDHVRADIVARDVVGPLKSRADYVLIDAGPLLPTGDTIALSEHVDAMVLVIGLNLLPMSALDELSPVLASSPAAELGFVVTSAEETLQPSLHSGASKRGDEPQNGRARANGDGQRKNGIAAAPDAEDRPFAAEY